VSITRKPTRVLLIQNIFRGKQAALRRVSGAAFYMWCGAVGCATDHRKRGRTPSAPALLEIMEAGLHRQARSVKPYLHDNDGG
jgi:hypothetical protein